MDPTDPTQAQFAAYRAMWDYFNVTLFGGVLRKVFLNFSRRAKSLGFFAPKRWESGDQVTHEISLNPSHLRRGSARDVASTLVHEMVHLWQYEHGTPKRAGYHDGQWAQKMEDLGLVPSSTGAPGGRRVGYKMSHYIREGGPFARAFDAMPDAYRLPWTCGIDEDALGKGKAQPRRKESKRKYTCPHCTVNVWGKPGLHVRCDDCGVALVSDASNAGDAGDVGDDRNAGVAVGLRAA